jgi:glycine hydroxymethyltransferase
MVGIKNDDFIRESIQAEEKRQKLQLQMIPSENYVSDDVMSALGSVVMNKYSEGQVGKRYYQGNTHIDEIEAEAKRRALEVFSLDDSWRVCVQAVSGSVANLAVYSALIDVGDKIMGMFLYDGGHLSHGWKLPNGKNISFTSSIYESYHYHADPKSGLFDYDQVEKEVQAVSPKILISGGTAYPREIDYKRLREIADSVGAIYLADVAHEAGLIAAGVNKSPFEYADVVTMTTRKTLRGPVGALIFSKKKYAKKIASAVMPGLQGGPMNHSIAGIAVALNEALQPEFKEYAKNVVENAKTLAESLTSLGYDVVSDGTDKHLLLVDLRKQGLNGKDVAIALEKANIICNKNTVPGETGSPWTPSGVRLGTPSLTSRGMTSEDMIVIAGWIDRVCKNIDNDDELVSIGKEVEVFTSKFPLRA